MHWWLVVLLLATGCNRIFSLDETYPIDARPDAVGCSGAVFAGPDQIGGFEDGDEEFDSQLRFDGLELWFTKYLGGSGNLDTFVARRANPNAAFGPPQRAVFDGPTNDYDSALSGDGLRLMFVTDRNGSRELFEVTRESLSGEFGAPGSVPVPDAEIDSIDLSDDGLRLYYANTGGDLWMAKRASVTDPFTAGTQLLTATAIFPTLSPDERELFYNRPQASAELWRMVRSDAGATFDLTTAVRLRDNGSDPDMAGDGTTMTLSINHGLAVMTRPCL